MKRQSIFATEDEGGRAGGHRVRQAEVALDDKKRIKVDAPLRTNVAGLWAIGDRVAGPMLVHNAEKDRAVVAEWIAGKAGPAHSGRHHLEPWRDKHATYSR